MAEMPESFFVHTAEVRPFAGHGPHGETYGPAFELPCFIGTGGNRVIGTTATGEQKYAMATVRCALSYEGQIPPESEISLHSDRLVPRIGVVAAVIVNDDGGYGAWQHLRLDVGST